MGFGFGVLLVTMVALSAISYFEMMRPTGLATDQLNQERKVSDALSIDDALEGEGSATAAYMIAPRDSILHIAKSRGGARIVVQDEATSVV